MRSSLLFTCKLALFILLTGCTSTPSQPGFDHVQAELTQRGIDHIHWHAGSQQDQSIAQAIQNLLDAELTADHAVQIALLNNRRLQATYEELGIAQSELVQAGLLRNPVFSAEILFPLNGGPTELTFGVTQSFLEILVIPLRKSVATSSFEEAKLRITGAVLDLAYETRVAFHHAQTASQRVEMFEQIVQTTQLSYDFAKRLHAAGNITDLELHRQRDLYEQSRIELRRAEAQSLDRREQVNQLMGVFGGQTSWRIAGRLQDIPDESPELTKLESRVIERSVDLAVAAQRIVTAGRQLGITDATALVPIFEAGVEVEHKGDWAIGPALSLPIPLFDQGQARLARNRAELRQQQHRYAALAVEIRSIARQARSRLESAQDVARHYRQVVLPLRERITRETQLQYNAMQVGLFDLLHAHKQQVSAGNAYIEALGDYWIARATIEQLLAGRTPGSSAAGRTDYSSD